ncbi:MAG: TolC family protein, partial [Planctomycetota bacterium]
IEAQARARNELEIDPNFIRRAAAANKRWEADVARAEASVRNAQLRLVALTNSTELAGSRAEFIPTSVPASVSPAISKTDILQEVLDRRPELQQAFLQYQAAQLREGMAANEDLPELELVLEGRLEGRDRDRKFGGAVKDSRFGGTVGVRFSIPLGYDERSARYERRRLETVQQRHQTRAAISTVVLEVEISASEYTAAVRDLKQQRAARLAAQQELETLRVQWQEGSFYDQPSIVLVELLGAYERANNLEKEVARARATLAVAAANFSRARGVLLDRWGIQIGPVNAIRDETAYRPARLKQ